MVALKAISQQPIDNAFHGLRFGAHSVQGIHGACPGELLHSLLLGIYKYVRDCFFEQVRRNWNNAPQEYRHAQTKWSRLDQRLLCEADKMRVAYRVDELFREMLTRYPEINALD